MAVWKPDFGEHEWVWNAICWIGAGSAWPEGDEDKMRELAQAWRDAAEVIGDALREADPAALDVLRAFGGGAGAAFASYWNDLAVKPGAGFPVVHQAAGELAEGTEAVAMQVEYEKLIVLISVIIAIVLIIIATVMAFFTAGGSLSAIPGIIATARQAVITAFRQLLTHAGRQLLKQALAAALRRVSLQALRHATATALRQTGRTAFTRLTGRAAWGQIGRLALKQTGIQVALQLGSEAGAQGYQIAAGHREGVDWGQLRLAGLSAALAGPLSIGPYSLGRSHSGWATNLLREGAANVVGGPVSNVLATGLHAGVADGDWSQWRMPSGGELLAAAVQGGILSAGEQGGAGAAGQLGRGIGDVRLNLDLAALPHAVDAALPAAGTGSPNPAVGVPSGPQPSFPGAAAMAGGPTVMAGGPTAVTGGSTVMAGGPTVMAGGPTVATGGGAPSAAGPGAPPAAAGTSPAGTGTSPAGAGTSGTGTSSAGAGTGAGRAPGASPAGPPRTDGPHAPASGATGQSAVAAAASSPPAQAQPVGRSGIAEALAPGGPPASARGEPVMRVAETGPRPPEASPRSADLAPPAPETGSRAADAGSRAPDGPRPADGARSTDAPRTAETGARPAADATRAVPADPAATRPPPADGPPPPGEPPVAGPPTGQTDGPDVRRSEGPTADGAHAYEAPPVDFAGDPTGPEARQAVTGASRDLADAVRALAEAEGLGRRQTPGMAGGMLTPDGTIHSHTSMRTDRGVTPPAQPHPHRLAQDVLDRVAADLAERGQRTGAGHGQCAEVALVSDRLYELERAWDALGSPGDFQTYARDRLAGSLLSTHRVGDLTIGDQRHHHGDYTPACRSCDPFLEAFGIQHVDGPGDAGPQFRPPAPRPPDTPVPPAGDQQGIPSQRGDLAGEGLVRWSADQPVEGGLAGEGVETSRPDGADADAGPAEPERVEPLTEAEYAEHVEQVRDRLAAAREQGLATDVQYTQNGDGQTWLPERARLQRDIAAEVYAQAADVPNERRAVMAGGLGGAGKSTVLSGDAGIERSRYLTINPDDIKELMAARGLVPQIEGLSAMEASDLVHEESSLIAKMIAERAYAEGKNIIWDITMSSYGSVQGRLDALRAAGYTHIEGVFVDIPVETSVERAEARHRRGHEEFRAGEGYGGRYVPPEVIRANAHQEWGSANRAIFEQLRDQFDRWSVFDNSVSGRDPVRVATGARAGSTAG